jgi:hypothetical protein
LDQRSQEHMYCAVAFSGTRGGVRAAALPVAMTTQTTTVLDKIVTRSDGCMTA